MIVYIVNFFLFFFFAVAPQRPRIEHKSVQILPGNNVTARAGDKTTVKCLSRYGNPPAKLKWFLGMTIYYKLNSRIYVYGLVRLDSYRNRLQIKIVRLKKNERCSLIKILTKRSYNLSLQAGYLYKFDLYRYS